MYSKRLKKFTSTSDVSLEYLVEVLNLWEASEVDADEVLLFAERIHDMGPGFPSYPNNDIRAVIVNILEAFVMMYSNPTSKEDIPALKACLEMANRSPEQALQFLDSYWKTIDWSNRLQRQYDSIKSDGTE